MPNSNSIAIDFQKLTNLLKLGSYAPIGASADDFANKIADELIDPTKLGFYLPFLDRVGFRLER